MLYRLLCFALVQTMITCGGEVVTLDENFLNIWGGSSSRMYQPRCLAIPPNMTLCHNIGYNTMRIPNLLDHDNLDEASTQAANWNALVGIRCHPDTQVFLCSLFSPVCLERVVYPCRSLCEGVQKGCEGYMKRYGFPWPDMFKCDKFPADNDLCMFGPSGSDKKVDDHVCKPCQQPDTYEGIIDNYCKSEYVVRATIRGLNTESSTARPGEIEVTMGKRKKRFYKKDTTKRKKKVYKLLAEKTTKIYISQGTGCTCGKRINPGEHHLMGIRSEENYDTMGQEEVRFYAEFITSWDDNGETKPGIKKALRAIRKNEDICKGGPVSLITHQEVKEENPERENRKREKKERKQRRRL